jgi:transcriptional regulator with XRE-family HTH domain
MRMKTEREISENECVIFGGFVKSTRLKQNIIAREAALNAGMLPSNFSKIEHGVLPPPRDAAKQKRLAAAIGVQPGTATADQFFDLAGKATGSVPVDLADIISEDEARPLLLRTIENKRLTEADIKRLIEIVRGIRREG